MHVTCEPYQWFRLRQNSFGETAYQTTSSPSPHCSWRFVANNEENQLRRVMQWRIWLSLSAREGWLAAEIGLLVAYEQGWRD